MTEPGSAMNVKKINQLMAMSIMLRVHCRSVDQKQRKARKYFTAASQIEYTKFKYR